MSMERRVAHLERECRTGWPGTIGLVDIIGLDEASAARVIAAQDTLPSWRPGDGIWLVLVDAYLGDDEGGEA